MDIAKNVVRIISFNEFGMVRVKQTPDTEAHRERMVQGRQLKNLVLKTDLSLINLCYLS